MTLIEETTVPDAALPVEKLKAHLRLGTGFSDGTVQDEVLVSFLRAAIAAVEARTGKALIERDFLLSVTEWRTPDGQILPVAPANVVSTMNYVDRLGERTDVDTGLYWLERDAHQPRVRSVGCALPAVPKEGAVEISFRAGFGATWDAMPPDLAQAVMLLAAHYYEFRHETTLSEGCMPFGVTSLIERYRVMRLGGRKV